MMNLNDKLEIAKRLRLSSEMEMSRDELEQLLEAELMKPEDEIDTEFVQQVLDLLEESPAPEQQHGAWKKVEKRLTARQWRPVVSGLARAAAILVFLAVVLSATYSTARAFSWEFLLRLMKPFAETFMVYTGNDPGPTAAPAVMEVYGDTGTSITQQEFSTLAACPDTIDGYPAKPVWMPERFVYLTGSMYSDMHITSVSHIFKSSDENCIIDVTVVKDSNTNDAYLFEQIPDENIAESIAGYQIAYYHNTDQNTLTASWVDENAHYFISGTLSKEDIRLILESMMK